MGRQWNQIIESLGPLSGGTGLSINANLTEIEALLTTLQADIVDGISVSNLLGDTDVSTLGANISTSFIYNFAGDNAAPPDKGIQLLFKSGSGDYQFTTSTSPLPTSSVITNGTITSGTLASAPIRGTTTIGTLTAGTTNGTLFATNSTRNYLLVQCTSGTAFIDTHGTATAANGIQLTSGQGITFEGSFIPTGAIAAITSTGTAQLIGRQG